MSEPGLPDYWHLAGSGAPSSHSTKCRQVLLLQVSSSRLNDTGILLPLAVFASECGGLAACLPGHLMLPCSRCIECSREGPCRVLRWVDRQSRPHSSQQGVCLRQHFSSMACLEDMQAPQGC